MSGRCQVLRCATPTQEFNICFTTVERGEEGAAPELPPPSREPAPLPVILAAILQVPPRSAYRFIHNATNQYLQPVMCCCLILGSTLQLPELFALQSYW